MKVRKDFVTNSSSASFILGMKGDFTEEQKKKIVEYVRKHLFGREVLTPESTEEEISKFLKEGHGTKYHEDEIREALKEGFSIYYDDMDLEIILPEDKTEIYENIWKMLGNNKNFRPISTDLNY